MADELELIDDLEDFELENNKVFYEVWLLGYDQDMNATDFEMLVDDDYTELAEARKCFEYMADIDNIAKLLEKIEVPAPTTHLHLMLEECVDNGTDGIECTDIIEEVEIF